ncbi:ATP-binding cassette domain-containing protein [Paenibacillus pasadenensis]|uniref:ABC transporter ATP-binding protein n=1 Tax=Paenibacillus pasadenensis TaxID=217090 RepID=UPI00203EAE97|nr:ATP-binding cassette domain-containing protein [Paenibacillus pasadenensis]MCM3746261.1 ATP-binding cassette domain-containing protein [Paenibacillus pasadenensis]
MNVLETKGLAKTFRIKRKEAGLGASIRSLWAPQWIDKQAVGGIDLTVAEGETVAFLGPNGAGKSTTIKMLTGILHPDSGEANVLGYVPWRDRKRLAYRIGTVFGQKSQLWYHLPPIDTFELMSRIYELDRTEFRQRRDSLIERFELAPYLSTPVRRLSLGERMRCEIACSFLHRPALLFLDEPTIGLDAIIKERIRELIAELNREEGTTVFLTSHDAGDIERLCRRAVVIHHGGIMVDGPVERLKRDILRYKTVTIRTPDAAGPELTFDSTGKEHPAALLSLPFGTQRLPSEPALLKLSVDLTVTEVGVVLAELMSRLIILDVTIEDPPMEEVIKTLYERNQEIPVFEEGTPP